MDTGVDTKPIQMVTLSVLLENCHGSSSLFCGLMDIIQSVLVDVREECDFIIVLLRKHFCQIHGVYHR